MLAPPFQLARRDRGGDQPGGRPVPRDDRDRSERRVLRSWRVPAARPDRADPRGSDRTGSALAPRRQLIASLPASGRPRLILGGPCADRVTAQAAPARAPAFGLDRIERAPHTLADGPAGSTIRVRTIARWDSAAPWAASEGDRERGFEAPDDRPIGRTSGPARDIGAAPIASSSRARPSSASRRLRARMGITRVANVTGLDRIGMPGGHGVPAEFPLDRGIAGQGAGSRRRARLGPDGGGRDLSCRADRSAAQARQLRGPARAPSRGRCRCACRGSTHGRFGPNLRSSVDRGPGPDLDGAGLAALRGRAHRLHPAPARRQRLLSRQHQRPRIGQPSARGDQPRDLRGGRARCRPASGTICIRRRRDRDPPRPRHGRR